MKPFNHYLKICFNNQNYTIEIPGNLEEIQNSSFYTKNENEESKIELNPEKVKEILDVVIKLKNNSLIYCTKKINESNLDLFSFGEGKKIDLYYTMKQIDKDVMHIKNVSNNDESENSLEKLTDKKKNLPNIKENISEIPYQTETIEKSSANSIITIFENNERKFNKEIEKLRYMEGELKDKINSLENKNKELNEQLTKQEEIIKHFRKSKINKVEMLSVPGINNKEEKVKETSCFAFNFYPEINISCYGVYECLVNDNNLIKNYIVPNIYSILKNELINETKNENRDNKYYKEMFNKCYKLINERLSSNLIKQNSKDKLLIESLSNKDISFSFLLFGEKEIVMANLGNSKIKKYEFDPNLEKGKCFDLKGENKNNEKNLNNNFEENIEIKMFPYSTKDKFFVMGNNQFWEYVFQENVEDIMIDYYINNDCKGAINKLYKLSREKLSFDNYIDAISIIVIFLNEEQL